MNRSTGMGNRLRLSGCGKTLLGLAPGVPFVSPNCSQLKPSISRSSHLLLEPTAAAWSPQSPHPCPKKETG